MWGQPDNADQWGKGADTAETGGGGGGWEAPGEQTIPVGWGDGAALDVPAAEEGGGRGRGGRGRGRGGRGRGGGRGGEGDEKLQPIKSDGWERVPDIKRKLVKTNEEPTVVDLTMDDEELHATEKKSPELINLDDERSTDQTMDGELNNPNVLQFNFDLNAQPYYPVALQSCALRIRWQRDGVRLRFNRVLSLTKQQPSVSLEEQEYVLVSSGAISDCDRDDIKKVSSFLEIKQLSLVFDDHKSLQIRIGSAAEGLSFNVYLLQKYLDEQLIDII